MKNPEKAIKVLIGDVCQDPEIISYSDRNSFMLAILLLRTYNQELRLDIEITPEQVLEVHQGLNRNAAAAAAEMIDASQEVFLTKIRTIHGKLLEAIAADETDEGVLPFRFLLSLEREACIFLSLVQGSTAKTVLRSAVKGYGDPYSNVYTLQNSSVYIQMILQHLKVMVRALGKLEDPEAMALFNDIRSKEAKFHRLGDGPQHESLVRSVMDHIQKARRVIYKKAQG
jgi:hypothetical protein